MQQCFNIFRLFPNDNARRRHGQESSPRLTHIRLPVPGFAFFQVIKVIDHHARIHPSADLFKGTFKQKDN